MQKEGIQSTNYKRHRGNAKYQRDGKFDPIQRKTRVYAASKICLLYFSLPSPRILIDQKYFIHQNSTQVSSNLHCTRVSDEYAC